MGENTSIEWTGGMPIDAEGYDMASYCRALGLTVVDVRVQLARHTLSGDNARGEIDMAIAMAAEPDGLPGDACVAVQFFSTPESLLCGKCGEPVSPSNYHCAVCEPE